MLHPPSTKSWLAAPGTILMLLVEEFSCQSSMERTCGQYCSSQSNGEGTKQVMPALEKTVPSLPELQCTARARAFVVFAQSSRPGRLRRDLSHRERLRCGCIKIPRTGAWHLHWRPAQRQRNSSLGLTAVSKTRRSLACF